MTVRLTADICAQAIVAACGVYETAPLKAFDCLRGPGRSALMAAASAAQKVTCASREQTARVFGVHPVSLARCEREGKPQFLKAAAAAWLAIDIEDVKAASPAPAPKPSKPVKAPAVDHRPAIAEALARHREKMASRAIVVVGVEADKASIGAGGCCWPPKGVVAVADEPICNDPAVPGRLFCSAHCLALGQKDTPVALAPAQMPQRYSERPVAG